MIRQILLGTIFISILGCDPSDHSSRNSNSDSERQKLIAAVTDSLNKVKDSTLRQDSLKQVQIKLQQASQEKKLVEDCHNKIRELGSIFKNIVIDENGIKGYFDNADSYSSSGGENLIIPYEAISQTRLVSGYNGRTPAIHLLVYGKWRRLVGTCYRLPSMEMEMRNDEREIAEFKQKEKRENDAILEKIHTLVKDIVKCKTNKSF